MTEHYEALDFHGNYEFTIAFPHGDMPSQDKMRGITALADDAMEAALRQVLARYCVSVGGFLTDQPDR